MQRITYDTNQNGIVDDSERLGGKPLTQIEQERATAIHSAMTALGATIIVATIAERDALSGLIAKDTVFVKDAGNGLWAMGVYPHKY